MSRKLKGKSSPSATIFGIVLLVLVLLFIHNRQYQGTKDGLLEVHSIDVGQGDSTLIRLEDKTVLIDAGTTMSESDLKAYLDYLGIRRIDLFIATHPHEDHIGGAAMILDSYEVDKLIMTDLEYNSYTFERLLDGIEKNQVYAEIPAIGDEYKIGDMTFTVLGPITKTDDANNMSLSVKLTYSETSFMFTGDCEWEVEAELVSRYGDELDCDYLKIPHHGSGTSSSVEFLEAVSPEIAAISCGRNNDYGHPHGKILTRLMDMDIETVLRTDKLGSFIVYSDGKSLFR